MKTIKPLLLIVEDDATGIMRLESILKDQYRLIPRKSGRQALNLFDKLACKISKDIVLQSEEVITPPQTQYTEDKAKALPDLILLDIEMPGMDGFEVCSILKQQPLSRDIPVIFISGNIDPDDITKGFEVGAIDYVTKPYNPAELKARLKTHYSLKSYSDTVTRNNILLKDQLHEIKEKTEQIRQKDMQLLMMDRIAGIGTLAAGVSHEINTPLGVIKSGVGKLKKDLRRLIESLEFWSKQPVSNFNPEEYITYLEKINFSQISNFQEERTERIDRNIQKIMKIVNSLKSLSRVDMGHIGQIDINNCINDALDIIKPSDKFIHFDTVFNGDIPKIECRPDEINQCLLHIIKNAIDAVTDSGKITITTDYISDRNIISISIADNGVGMSEESLSRAFLPFFTTKPVGSGTGVGLSISEHIIKNHNGTISLQSTEGKGTTVIIELPADSHSSPTRTP
ncbi:MAG: response regulator [Desulfamplus sp.]|nr:response regulator [Desulfamplus sp.]